MEFVQSLFILLLLNVCWGTGDEAHSHQNPCLEHTVESLYRSTADYFKSNSLFFPSEYREVYCNTYSSSNSLNAKLSTCAGGLYHCVTEYRTKEVLEIPNEDPVSLSKLGIRKIRLAVGCVCLT